MTSFLQKKKFDFVSSSFPSDTFDIVTFEGTEGISSPYRFDILLVSEKDDIDLGQVLRSMATLTILRPEGDIPFHGVLAEFEQRQCFNKYAFYRAVLVPRFARLQLTFHNQVFLEKTVPQFLEQVLIDGGLTKSDFELRLVRDYPQWEFVCQYQESHFAFVSRWMEREGIYYFFEQTSSGDRVILTDSEMAHVAMAEGKTMLYSPPSGLVEPFREEVIHSFLCRQRMIPKKVILKDYNYRTPSLELTGQADVSADGLGEVYIYGEHFRTPKEGDGLAEVRAQELLCRERLFQAESTIPYLRPGYIFDLEDHFREDYNMSYLTTDLHHRGSQASYLTAGLKGVLSEREQGLYYQNDFTVIPLNVQYRPERKTPPSRFYGTMNARIDGEGGDSYAELDNQGRYKVVLPFDRSGRQGGKASAWLRMAQPYAGSNHGMHFPLHKGTEVLLAFIDGNPDRPIVASAVPNPITPSVVSDVNQTSNVIRTSGGNLFEMEDQGGTRRIKLATPHGGGSRGTYMHMGAPNHPGDGWVVVTDGMERKEIQGGQQITVLAHPIGAGSTVRTITEMGDDVSTREEAGSGPFIEVASIPVAKAVKVYQLPSADGVWEYRSSGVWVPIDQSSLSVSGSNWLFLSTHDGLRFVPRDDLDLTNPITEEIRYIEVDSPAVGELGGTDGFDTSVNEEISLSVGEYPGDPYYADHTIAIATPYLAVTAVTPTSDEAGKWEYLSEDTGEWVKISTPSSSEALYLANEQTIRFTPYPALPGAKTLFCRSGRSWSDKVILTVPSESCAPLTVTSPGELEYDAVSHSESSGRWDGRWELRRQSDDEFTPLAQHGDWEHNIYFNAGDQLRFVPKACAGADTPTITYYKYLSTGLHTSPTITDVSGERTLDLTIESDDLIDEDELFEFKKQENDGVDTLSDTDRPQPGDAFDQDEELSGNYIIHRQKGPKYSWRGGPDYHYKFGSSLCATSKNNISGQPVDSSEPPDANILDDVFGSSPPYCPTGNLDYDTASPRRWMDIVKGAHVSLGYHDTVKGQKGNIYDFGGYWNYNLGNCYVEAHLNQQADLNSQPDYDMLDIGGPGWCSSGTGWRTVKKSSNELTDKALSSSNGWKNIWVGKKFGDEYSYTEGSSISVTKGSSQSITVGGRHIEEKYAGDTNKRTLWSRSEGGISEEKRWGRNSGGLMAWSISDASKDFRVDSFDFSFINKASASFAFSTSASFSCEASASIAISLSLTASTKISICPGLEIDLKVPIVTPHIKVDKSGEVDIDFMGVKLKTAPPVRAEKSTVDVEWDLVLLRHDDWSLKRVGAYISTGLVKMFG